MSKNINILKLFTVASICFLLPLVFGSVNPQSSLSSVALAEEEKKEPKYKNVKTRQRQSVGAKCAKALEKIQVVLEEEENFVFKFQTDDDKIEDDFANEDLDALDEKWHSIAEDYLVALFAS